MDARPRGADKGHWEKKAKPGDEERVNQSRHQDLLDADATVIFSLVDGWVWASWPGALASVKLGKHHDVCVMMEDFLAQTAIGERLALRQQEIGK